jgi:uncharacterized phage protein (TIGR01671 family)
MRTIKFRAWIPRLKIYEPVLSLDWHVVELDIITKSSQVRDSDMILEQFTGLFDKNGKEIYEGDILKWPYIVLGIVSFLDGRFVIDNIRPRKSLIDSIDKYGKDLEVIGNIHENQELLK